MSSRRLLTLSLALFALLAAGTISAAAAPGPSYQVWTCDQASDAGGVSGAAWTHSWQNSRGQNLCPATGLTFDTLGPIQFGYQDSWSLGAGDAKIDRISLRIAGGDSASGYKYTISACGNCDPLIVLPTRTATSTAVDLSYPLPDVDGVAIQATCGQEQCSAARGFAVKNLRLHVVDAKAPITFGPVSNAFGMSESPNSVAWIKPDLVNLHTAASDGGSGVRSTTLILDPGTPDAHLIWTAPAVCDDGVPTPDDSDVVFGRALICPAATALNDLVDLRNSKAGVHKIQTDATDAVGNTTHSIPLYFGIDDSPPPAPRNLGFDTDTRITKYGWTSQPGFRLTWDDANTMAEMQTGADVADVRFGLESLPTGANMLTRSAGTDNSGAIAFPHEGRWRAAVRFRDTAGNVGDRSYLDIGYDKDVPSPPSPAQNPWISLDQLHSGYEQTWLPPSAQPELESGICSYRFAVDNLAHNDPSDQLAIEAPVTHATIPASVGEGRHYSHLRSVSCAGLPSTTVDTAIDVDGAAPALRLYGLPETPWSRTPIKLNVTAADALSGVDHLSYRINGGAISNLNAPSAPLTVGEGESKLTYWATDFAGNATAQIDQTIRVDETPPSAFFKANDRAHPARFVASIADPLSGIADAWIEYRRVDAGADAAGSRWKTLGAPVSASPSERHALEIVRDLPDEALEDGSYELRIIANDIAGNTGIGGEPLSGAALPISLPLRSKTNVSALIANVVRTCEAAGGATCKASSCARKKKCTYVNEAVRAGAGAKRVRGFRDRSALIGELLDAAGDPIPWAELAIYSTEKYGSRILLGHVTTNAHGEYEQNVPQGPSRELDVEFNGDAHRLPAASAATLGIRPALSLKVSKTRVKPGDRIVFSGRLASGAAWIPKIGKGVQIQYVRAGKWVDTVGEPDAAQNGRYSVPWNWGAVAQPTTFFFRALVRPVPLWPFEAGTSPVVRVSAIP